MSKEVVAEVIALIELGMIAPEDIVKCLRKANSEPAQQQEPLIWGVDWGKAGDTPCVSIIKRLADGRIEAVAVEYGPTLPSWIEVQQVKWEGDKLLAKRKENT